MKEKLGFDGRFATTSKRKRVKSAAIGNIKALFADRVPGIFGFSFPAVTVKRRGGDFTLPREKSVRFPDGVLPLQPSPRLMNRRRKVVQINLPEVSG